MKNGSDTSAQSLICCSKIGRIEMSFQGDQSVMKKLYEVLGFQPGQHMVTSEVPSDEVYQTVFFELARRKLGIESVFFYKPPSGGSGVPYIYFRRLEGQDPAQISRELAELHKLAWNMGKAPLLFAVVPDGQVRIYNTYDPPVELDESSDYSAGLIETLNVFSETADDRQRLLAYHRREFESGRYWQRNKSRFDPRTRADHTLLENLKIVRRGLIESLSKKLSRDIASSIVNSLLGRSIFVKYLEDRKDSNGENVFPSGFFGRVSQGATCFTDVLLDKEATYELFQHLSEKFNGDLFPVASAEKKHITIDHLRELSRLLAGQAELRTGQLGLWRFYSFDVIPIEFISNIYEEFFHIQRREESGAKVGTGTHYTPYHLVEFLVDQVLPWDGTTTNVKVLDPACGSGIFLVEVYRRLIAHWHQANPGKKITPDQLKELLTNNIFGVDLDPEAIRVAAFSLYLTLCDFLEPRQIWDRVTFSPLRWKNLFPTDFFDQSADFVTQHYDFIIGNPPWQSELTPSAEQYRANVELEFPDRQVAPDNQIALAFLWRAAELSRQAGELCLFMPSKGLLFNRSRTHRDFRRDFFSTFDVKTIINFSASRHSLFKEAVGPGAAVFYTPEEPDETVPVLYCTPKPTHSPEDEWLFTIEPYDIALLPRVEARESVFIWKVAMWGGPRDYELIKKLMAPPFQTLDQICQDRDWVHAEGIIEGKKDKDASWLVERILPYVDARNLARFTMRVDDLPIFNIRKLYRMAITRKEIFDGPHILLKQSPVAGEHSFRAVLLRKDAVFTQSLIGIHDTANDMNALAQCCLALNSRIPLYFALMSSGRWLVERDELAKEEAMSSPMPRDLFDNSVSYHDLRELASDPNWEEKIKDFIERLYDLTQDEQILVDDALNYTLDYFRAGAKSEAAERTYTETDGERFLQEYLQVARRTLQGSFGKYFKSIIFQGTAPLRVVALNLLEDTEDSTQSLVVEKSERALEQALGEVNRYLAEQLSQNVFILRNVRAYIGKTVYIIKPDQRRHWTRSSALRDADEIYSDIMEAWRSAS
jgi:hypothetical protein